MQIAASSDLHKMVTKHGQMTYFSGNHSLLCKLLQYKIIIKYKHCGLIDGDHTVSRDLFGPHKELGLDI